MQFLHPVLLQGGILKAVEHAVEHALHLDRHDMDQETEMPKCHGPLISSTKGATGHLLGAAGMPLTSQTNARTSACESTVANLPSLPSATCHPSLGKDTWLKCRAPSSSCATSNMIVFCALLCRCCGGCLCCDVPHGEHCATHSESGAS